MRYARSVSPVLGLGELLAADQAGASYTRVVPGGVVAALQLDRAWGRIPASPGQRLVATTASADLQRPIGRGLWVGARGAHYTRAQGGAVRSHDLALRAGFATAWGAVR